MATKDDNNALPYLDDKPVGAADFYFAINATFRFILARAGLDGLRRYWTDLGSTYFAPVSQRWKANGLTAIEQYWTAFFKAEPGSEVEVRRTEDMVTVEVKVCPAIAHLRQHNREIVPCFCQHCYFISESIAAPAGFTARVRGGNGSCTQTFQPSRPEIAPQDLTEIAEAAC
ncbi:MAG: hypothetical protein IT423_19435 [Pirellulaceae bacterium]|nr:hypothetical protein [Pirellulaceae bacterium]